MFSSNTSQVSNDAVYIEDVFSTYLYAGNGLGQIITNGVALGTNGTGGSGFFNGSSYLSVFRDAVKQNSDFTFECWIYPTSLATVQFLLANAATNYAKLGIDAITGYPYIDVSGIGVLVTSSTAVTTQSWNHIAMVRSGSDAYIYLNGNRIASASKATWVAGSGNANLGAGDGGGEKVNGYISNIRFVYGTALYTGATYTVPTASLTAISGTSLLTLQGASPFTDNSGNGYTISMTGSVTASIAGPFASTTAAKGGMVWVKNRTEAWNHYIADTVRGSLNYISSNTTSASQASLDDIFSFTSIGFNVGGGSKTNRGGTNVTSWTFAKQPKFFDVVTWTGDGTGNINIPHNLGSVPGCIMMKKTSAALDWYVYHRDLNYPNAGSPQSNTLKLNTTDAGLNSTAWQSGPTSTYFPVLGSAFNVSGATYVAYLFAHNAGGFGLTGTDNVISCGSFTTDASGNATVNLGYEPQWILYKASSAANGWAVIDTMRGWNQTGFNRLLANTSGAEVAVSGAYESPNATGFALTNGYESPSTTFIYIAIRRGPMKVPTSGTSVFAPTLQSASTTPQTKNYGITTDSVLALPRNIAGYSNSWWSRLQGANIRLTTQSTNAESSASTDALIGFDAQTGVRLGADSGGWIQNGANWVHLPFQRAPSFFDEICYTGDSNYGRQLTHNLTVSPQLLIIKARSGPVNQNWQVCYNNNGSYVQFNNTNAGQISDNWFPATGNIFFPTYVRVGAANGVNNTDYTYVAYLFATCPGVSKVGSYTGTGSTQTISCGFTGGARFVLIKRTDSTGDWYVWDTARGMVSGTDPSLLLNSTAAEVNADSIYTTTGGFQIVSTAAGINASGGSYIYLAIA